MFLVVLHRQRGTLKDSTWYSLMTKYPSLKERMAICLEYVTKTNKKFKPLGCHLHKTWERNNSEDDEITLIGHAENIKIVFKIYDIEVKDSIDLEKFLTDQNEGVREIAKKVIEDLK